MFIVALVCGKCVYVCDYTYTVALVCVCICDYTYTVAHVCVWTIHTCIQ